MDRVLSLLLSLLCRGVWWVIHVCRRKVGCVSVDLCNTNDFIAYINDLTVHYVDEVFDIVGSIVD